jgi:hypothetical protein
MHPALERAAKKWLPVFRKKAREFKDSRACGDSTQSPQALDGEQRYPRE